MSFVTCNEILWVFYGDLQKEAAVLFMLLLRSLCGERMETFCSCRIKLWRGRGGGSSARVEIEVNGKNYGILLLLSVWKFYWAGNCTKSKVYELKRIYCLALFGRHHFNITYFGTGFQEVVNMSVFVSDVSERHTRNCLLLCNHDKMTNVSYFF